MESNVQKMRKTLEVVRDALTTISAHENDVEFVRTWIAMTKKEVAAALAMPMRQCDVGTAEEQEARFKKFCAAHWSINNVDSECEGCPITIEGAECEFAWAQMPYEEGGSK